MSELTSILDAIEQGDPHAADRLLPLVYGVGTGVGDETAGNRAIARSTTRTSARQLSPGGTSCCRAANCRREATRATSDAAPEVILEKQRCPLREVLLDRSWQVQSS
jgi:hypothetical protein